MKLNPSRRRWTVLAVAVFALAFATIGLTARYVLRQDEMHESRRLDFQNEAFSVWCEVHRKPKQIIGIPHYVIILEDRNTGKMLPLATFREVFQETYGQPTVVR